MKRIYRVLMLLSIVFVTATACKKGYICECKSNGVVVDSTPINDLGRMGAKNVCDNYEVQNNAQGARQVCTLK